MTLLTLFCCRCCCCTSTKNNVTTTAPNITTTSTTDDNDNGDILKYILHYCLNDVTVGALMGFKLLRSDVWCNAIGWWVGSSGQSDGVLYHAGKNRSSCTFPQPTMSEHGEFCLNIFTSLKFLSHFCTRCLNSGSWYEGTEDFNGGRQLNVNFSLWPPLHHRRSISRPPSSLFSSSSPWYHKVSNTGHSGKPTLVTS